MAISSTPHGWLAVSEPSTFCHGSFCLFWMLITYTSDLIQRSWLLLLMQVHSRFKFLRYQNNRSLRQIGCLLQTLQLRWELLHCSSNLSYWLGISSRICFRSADLKALSGRFQSCASDSNPDLCPISWINSFTWLVKDLGLDRMISAFFAMEESLLAMEEYNTLGSALGSICFLRDLIKLWYHDEF